MGVYNRKTLSRALEITKRPQTFLRDTFFTDTERFTSKAVDMDVEVEVRTMAEYVNRGEKSKTVKTEGYTTQNYIPPLISLNDTVTEEDLFNRLPGEDPYMATPEQVEQWRVSKILSKLDGAITRREEYQCMEAIFNGSVSLLNGDTIGFKRNGAHTVTNSGTDLWTDAASDPYDQFREWKKLITKNSGAQATDIILGEEAETALRNNTKFLALLDKYKVNIGQYQPEQLAPGVTLLCQLPSIGNIWAYDAYYVDPSDSTEKALVPAKKIAMVARGARFTKNYGAVSITQNDRVSLVPGVRVVDTDLQKDPAVRKIFVKSAPLMSINNANATLSAQVVS